MLLEMVDYWGHEEEKRGTNDAFRRPNEFRNLYKILSDEGVVFPESYTYLNEFKIELVKEVERRNRNEALEVSIMKIEKSLLRNKNDQYEDLGNYR